MKIKMYIGDQEIILTEKWKISSGIEINEVPEDKFYDHCSAVILNPQIYMDNMRNATEL